MSRPAVRTVEHFDTEDTVDVIVGEANEGGALVRFDREPADIQMSVADMEAAIVFFRRLISAATPAATAGAA